MVGSQPLAANANRGSGTRGLGAGVGPPSVIWPPPRESATAPQSFRRYGARPTAARIGALS